MSNTCIRYSKQALAPIVSLVTVLFNSVVWLGSRAKSQTGKGTQKETFFCSSFFSRHFHIFLSHRLSQLPEPLRVRLLVILRENRLQELLEMCAANLKPRDFYLTSPVTITLSHSLCVSCVTLLPFPLAGLFP